MQKIKEKSGKGYSNYKPNIDRQNVAYFKKPKGDIKSQTSKSKNPTTETTPTAFLGTKKAPYDHRQAMHKKIHLPIPR